MKEKYKKIRCFEIYLRCGWSATIPICHIHSIAMYCYESCKKSHHQTVLVNDCQEHNLTCTSRSHTQHTPGERFSCLVPKHLSVWLFDPLFFGMKQHVAADIAPDLQRPRDRQGDWHTHKHTATTKAGAGSAPAQRARPLPPGTTARTVPSTARTNSSPAATPT